MKLNTKLTDEEIRGEIERLSSERGEFARSNRGPFPEDALASLEAAREEARLAYEQALARQAADGRFSLESVPGFVVGLKDLAALRAAARDDGFAAECRQAIKAATQPPMSKAEVTKRTARFDREIRALEQDLLARDLARRREQLDLEEAALGRTS